MPALVETMSYAKANGVPWHGMGVPLGEDELTSKDVIVKSGLDWDVEAKPVYIRIGDKYTRVKERVAITRKTDGKVYCVPTSRYGIIQNRDAFDFLDSLAAEGDLKYETAISLLGGSKVCMLARMPDTVIVGDLHHRYLFCHTSHDGSAVMTAFPTTVRVVCHNTFKMALNQAAAENALKVSIWHTTNWQARAAKAQDILKTSLGLFSAFAEKAETLATIPAQPILEAATEVLFPLPREARVLGPDGSDMTFSAPSEREKVPLKLARRNEAVTVFNRIYLEEADAKGANAYSLFNAATGYADHGWRRQPSKSDLQERRFLNTMMWDAARFKQKAFDTITELAGIS